MPYAKLFMLYTQLLRSFFCGVKVGRRAQKIGVGRKTVNEINPSSKVAKLKSLFSGRNFELAVLLVGAGSPVVGKFLRTSGQVVSGS